MVCVFARCIIDTSFSCRGEMSTKAILNVEVDRLTGEYQDKLGAYSSILHMYPSSPAVLEIIGMTITSNIRYQLIKAYSEPKYIQYLQRKNKWNNKNGEFNSIEMFEPGTNKN